MRYIIKKRGVKVRRGVWRMVANDPKVNKCRGIQKLKERKCILIIQQHQSRRSS